MHASEIKHPEFPYSSMPDISWGGSQTSTKLKLHAPFSSNREIKIDYCHMWFICLHRIDKPRKTLNLENPLSYLVLVNTKFGGLV
jgi:hypothetical protein